MPQGINCLTLSTLVDNNVFRIYLHYEHLRTIAVPIFPNLHSTRIKKPGLQRWRFLDEQTRVSVELYYEHAYGPASVA